MAIDYTVCGQKYSQVSPVLYSERSVSSLSRLKMLKKLHRPGSDFMPLDVVSVSSRRGAPLAEGTFTPVRLSVLRFQRPR